MACERGTANYYFGVKLSESLGSPFRVDCEEWVIFREVLY